MAPLCSDLLGPEGSPHRQRRPSGGIPSIALCLSPPVELQGVPLALATCELCIIDCPPQIQKTCLYPFPPLFIHPPSAFSNVRTFGCPSSVPKNVILWFDFCFPPPGCGLRRWAHNPPSLAWSSADTVLCRSAELGRAPLTAGILIPAGQRKEADRCYLSKSNCREITICHFTIRLLLL